MYIQLKKTEKENFVISVHVKSQVALLVDFISTRVTGFSSTASLAVSYTDPVVRKLSTLSSTFPFLGGSLEVSKEECSPTRHWTSPSPRLEWKPPWYDE